MNDQTLLWLVGIGSFVLGVIVWALVTEALDKARRSRRARRGRYLGHCESMTFHFTTLPDAKPATLANPANKSK